MDFCFTISKVKKNTYKEKWIDGFFFFSVVVFVVVVVVIWIQGQKEWRKQQQQQQRRRRKTENFLSTAIWWWWLCKRSKGSYYVIDFEVFFLLFHSFGLPCFSIFVCLSCCAVGIEFFFSISIGEWINQSKNKQQQQQQPE